MSQTQQQQQATGTPAFLTYARTQANPVQIGSVAAGNAGGQATSLVAWNPSDIQEVPFWLSSLDLAVTLPVALTIPASGVATMSPWAPYCALSPQMILSGAPEWPATTSFACFWLDNIVRSRGFDPAMVGPNIAAPTPGNPLSIPAWFDQGPTPYSFNTGSTTLLPGQTITNSGTAAETVHIILIFQARIQFQRRPSRLWGAIPLGDPANRPQFKLMLNALVGPNPENNLIQDRGAAGITAVLDTGGLSVNAVYRSKSLDVLPAGTTQPTPTVVYGLNVNYTTLSLQNAGQIYFQYQREAQIYTSIHHLFVNSQAAIDPDYFGLWLSNNRANARWEYDNTQGTMQDYYMALVERYHRYLPKGHFVADLEGGGYPDIPRESPYNGLMSPDRGYAAQAEVPVTPNMGTAFRIPTGTSMSGAYAALYAIGLVGVPY